MSVVFTGVGDGLYIIQVDFQESKIYWDNGIRRHVNVWNKLSVCQSARLKFIQ